MSNIVRLDKHRAAARNAKRKGKTLCGSGFHAWQVVTERQFDVKQGKLLTLYRCSRCGKQKTRTQ